MTIEQIVDLAKKAKFKEIKSLDPSKRAFLRIPSFLSVSISGPWTYYPEGKNGEPYKPIGQGLQIIGGVPEDISAGS
jgi:hypothetical protein